MPSLHTNTGAKRAREAREQMALASGPIADLLAAVESRAPVIVRRFAEDFAGAVRREGARSLIFVNGDHHPVRQRFTLAHELGHICCGHDSETIVDTVSMVSGGDTSSVEVQANAFAAEFLVPAVAIKQAPDEPGLEDVVRLAAAFGVSALVVLFRFRTLGKVSDDRSARISSEIAADHHHELAGHLGLPSFDDRLTRLTDEDLPYISPGLADSALGAALRGETSFAAAATAAGISERRLSRALS